MSVTLRCDDCGELVANFSLPQKFANEETGIEVEIGVLNVSGGKQEKVSLDYCRRCFCQLLVVMATAVAPPGIHIDWREEGWKTALPQEETQT